MFPPVFSCLNLIFPAWDSILSCSSSLHQEVEFPAVATMLGTIKLGCNLAGCVLILGARVGPFSSWICIRCLLWIQMPLWLEPSVVIAMFNWWIMVNNPGESCKIQFDGLTVYVSWSFHSSFVTLNSVLGESRGQKTRMYGFIYTYPLHEAVKQQNAVPRKKRGDLKYQAARSNDVSW